MKKFFYIIFVLCYLESYSQDIIVSDKVKQYRKLVDSVNIIGLNAARDKTTVLEAIKNYENSFKLSHKDESWRYINYADLLAITGNFKKAIKYYDLAFKSKRMTTEEFSYPYRKGYWEKDTTLYNKKLKEYIAKSPTQFTPEETEIIQTLKELLAIDQLARKYWWAYPTHITCTKNIIMYTDSIVMIDIVELIQSHPNIKDAFYLDFEAAFVIGRHLFTAYPEFWLTYFEPDARKNLINGDCSPDEYARTYDRCIIMARGEKSYYGEWDNNGEAVNPNVDKVNQRRFNIGLPPLEEKEEDSMKIFITY
jgi:tetratricopeptide (TPR) repeat protein